MTNKLNEEIARLGLKADATRDEVTVAQSYENEKAQAAELGLTEGRGWSDIFAHQSAKAEKAFADEHGLGKDATMADIIAHKTAVARALRERRDPLVPDGSCVGIGTSA